MNPCGLTWPDTFHLAAIILKPYHRADRVSEEAGGDEALRRWACAKSLPPLAKPCVHPTTQLLQPSYSTRPPPPYTPKLLPSIPILTPPRPLPHHTYTEWKRYYRKSYATTREEATAFDNFRKTLQRMAEVNTDLSLPFWLSANEVCEGKTWPACGQEVYCWWDQGGGAAGVKDPSPTQSSHQRSH